MKTTILVLLVGLCYTLPSQAQTKKIALRSHSGNNTTFTLFVPDDFGMAFPDDRPRRISKEEALKLRKKKTTPLKTVPTPSIPTPLELDSLHQCAPPDNDIYKNKKVKKKPTTPKTKSDSVLVFASNTEISAVNRSMNFPKHDVNYLYKEEISSPNSSLSALVLLLSLPSLISLFFFFQKP